MKALLPDVVWLLAALAPAAQVPSHAADAAAVTSARIAAPLHWVPGGPVEGAEDLDGDGVVDFATISPCWLDDCPRVLATWSGRDGSLLEVFTPPPWDVALVPDLDGDGCGELVLTGGSSRFPSVSIASGRTGELLHAWWDERGRAFTVVPIERRGREPGGFAVLFETGVVLCRARSRVDIPFGRGDVFELASLGDVDGDGLADVAVVQAERDAATGRRMAWIRIHSGSTGDGLRVHHDFTDASRATGDAIDGIGDVDGDGLDDYVIGNDAYDDHAGTATVRSGLDGRRLFTLHRPTAHGDVPLGTSEDRFGCAVAGVGDTDGDGTPDIAVGAPAWYGMLPEGADVGSYVAVYSGCDGALIATAQVESFNDIGIPVPLGSWIGPLGDVDGDGLADFAAALDRDWAFLWCSVDRVYVVGGGSRRH